MSSTIRRRLVVWQATHENGWLTTVAEQPDGTFVAWAGSDHVLGVDYVEDTPEHAQAAALFALKRKSGHATCSTRCTDWEMHTHEMTIAAPDALPKPSRTRHRGDR